ncbi:MAG: SRPBCC family protein [candidate division Zixibacteria bacterium]|nr:SRPBCC family protein [candidate division Zixibacteria bacterium]
MSVYTLIRTQLIRRPLREVFAFFENPQNLERITPDTVGFRILTPLPVTMKTGAVIDYTIRVFGLRRFWTTLITDYEPPHRFVDVQLKGPYAFWHHTHAFEETVEGTLMHDTVRYLVPFGVVGRLIHGLLVSRQLRKIFDYRAAVIADHFEPYRAVAGERHR